MPAGSHVISPESGYPVLDFGDSSSVAGGCSLDERSPLWRADVFASVKDPRHPFDKAHYHVDTGQLSAPASFDSLIVNP